jgi:hypothetical protein
MFLQCCLILMATLLAGCGGRASPALLSSATLPPTPSQPGGSPGCGDLEEVTVDVSPVPLQPANILLQLAWEGGLTRPELAFVFGRVPEFTLLTDGRAFYKVQDDLPTFDRGQMDVPVGDVLEPACVGHERVARGQGIQFDSRAGSRIPVP